MILTSTSNLYVSHPVVSIVKQTTFVPPNTTEQTIRLVSSDFCATLYTQYILPHIYSIILSEDFSLQHHFYSVRHRKSKNIRGCFKHSAFYGTFVTKGSVSRLMSNGVSKYHTQVYKTQAWMTLITASFSWTSKKRSNGIISTSQLQLLHRHIADIHSDAWTSEF